METIEAFTEIYYLKQFFRSKPSAPDVYSLIKVKNISVINIVTSNIYVYIGSCGWKGIHEYITNIKVCIFRVVEWFFFVNAGQYSKDNFFVKFN